ncbi:class II aldolase/adducin family protein [Nocardiopsis oceani]
MPPSEPTVRASSTNPTGLPSDERAKALVATACRMLAHCGLGEDVLGHVSVRTSGDRFRIRCRGPRERGLLFTDPEDVRAVSFESGPSLPPGYNLPNESPIHEEVLRHRADTNAVVHVHPPAVIAADLAGLSLRPIIGAYNIPAMRLANEGIPTYHRSVLINSPGLAKEVVEVLADKPVCVLRGHGIVSTGVSVEQAVVRALNIEALARMTLAASQFGNVPPELPKEDVAALPDLGSEFNDHQVWAHHIARLEHAGLAIDHPLPR